MYKIDQDPGVLFGNVQMQPSKFEPLESGNDSVDINLSESDSSSEQDGITISTTKESTIWIGDNGEPFWICCKLLFTDQ